MKKVYNQLSNIMTIAAPDEPMRLVQALAKKQKDILSAFDALDDFQNSFK
jgi:hypothetical protein